MSETTTSTGFLKACLDLVPGASVLVIAYKLPTWLEAHEGEICFLGRHPPGTLKSRDYRFVLARSADAIGAALARLKRAGQSYDLVYIDHEHGLASLAVQLNGALGVTRPTTVFAFDDVVPPNIEMARAAPPPEGGWCGEVWMLPRLLSPGDPGFFLTTCALPPTGLMLARGFAPLDLAATRETHARLAALATTEEMHAAIPLSAPAAALDQAKAAFRATQDAPMRFVVAATEDGPPARRVKLFDPPARWTKPDPLFVEDLSGHALDTAWLRRRERTIHAKRLDEFEDVHLVGSQSIIAGELHLSRVDNSEPVLRRIASHPDGYANLGTGLRMVGERIGLPLARLETAERLAGPVLHATPDEPDNWGMWLFFALPSLDEFVRNRGDHWKLLCEVRHGWQRDLLRLFGVTEADWLPHDRARAYHAPRLRMIRRTRRDLCVTESDRALFAALRERFSAEAPAAGPERIFVSRLSRSRKGAYRALQNEEELVERVRDLGFAVVEPEFLSFPDQVRLFGGAKVIAGLGGAGMFNAVFCRPGTRVVTIESTTVYVEAHTNLFASAGAEWAVILGREDRDDPRPEQRRWTLDVGGAVAALRRAA